MALTLPFHIFQGVCRLCNLPREATSSKASTERLADMIISNASLIDVIRWRRVSKAFQKAADRRLGEISRIDVRVYNGISKMFGHQCERRKDEFEWHPHASVLLMEMGVGQLGIAIDTKLRKDDVRALIQILTVFRATVAQLFIDCPIIELLVSQINREQVNLLMEMLRNSRIISPDELPKKCNFNSVVRKNSIGSQSGTFFPKLKKLTITSQSNQLEILSRLLTYAVGVDYLYETDNIDLLCLKIVLGGRGHSNQKRHFRLFRHLTKFRQWTAADRLGERYFQQFSGSNRNL